MIDRQARGWQSRVQDVPPQARRGLGNRLHGLGFRGASFGADGGREKEEEKGSSSETKKVSTTPGSYTQVPRLFT